MPEPTKNFNHNQPVYTVSEVSQSIKRMVEDHFGLIRLRGEITGLEVASTGHAYFRLKDESNVINAVCWKGTLSKFRFKPEEGMDVIVTGKMTTYAGRSSYQIQVSGMEPAGEGALMAILEKRRKALEAEGLFAASRKKELPFMPRVVGVVTSPTGAVIRDILHRIEDRFPCHVLVWPVKVQGEGAAEQVAAAIDGFNRISLGHPSRPDVLIVARGGGSAEDLWPFNEEVVVRAAASSVIPLISAVGHETDTTLIDFASDKRAPTPTAAAEMAVPVLADQQLIVAQLGKRMFAGFKRLLITLGEKLIGLSRGLPRPAELLEAAQQRFADWGDRLSTSLPALLARKEQQLAVLAAGLRPAVLAADIQQRQMRLDELQERLVRAYGRGVQAQAERLENMAKLLESVNYERVLARGFALVRGADEHVVTSAKAAGAQSALSITFADGTVKVKPA